MKSELSRRPCCLLVEEISMPTCAPGTRAGQPIVMWGFPGALGADFPRSDGAVVMKSASSIAAVLPAYL